MHDGALPQPRDVGEARVRTLEHIPKKMRHKVAVVFGRLLSDAAHDKGDRAWTLVLMFAKCVLRAAPRGRKAYHDAADVEGRLVRWEEGRYAELWAECLEIDQKGTAPDPLGGPVDAVKRAVALLPVFKGDGAPSVERCSGAVREGGGDSRGPSPQALGGGRRPARPSAARVCPGNGSCGRPFSRSRLEWLRAPSCCAPSSCRTW